jgi:hypothetical protein
MKNMWEEPKMKALAERIRQLIDTLRFGDPLLVSRNYGKGRVVACLTTAGTSSKWNDWGQGSPISWSYVPFVMDLQRYLSSSSDDLNRLVGDKISFQLEAAKYNNRAEVEKYLQPEPSEETKEDFNATRKAGRPEVINLKTKTQEGDNVYDLTVTETKQPGLYNYKFFQTPGNGVEERPYAFNVDAENEGDLRRAATDKLLRPEQGQDTRKGKLQLREYGEGEGTELAHKPDASELWWPYLLFLLILVVEQALAVHLSFHLRGDTTAAPAGAVPATA